MKTVGSNALRLRVILTTICLFLLSLILLGVAINTKFSDACNAILESPLRDPSAKLLLDAERQVWLLLTGGLLLVCIGMVLVTDRVIRRLAAAEREKAALEAALAQSGKMAALGQMAAGMAHEINNPLAIIREQAGWMMDLLEEEDVQDSPNFQEIKDTVKRIEQHVERASSVARRMLGFARRTETEFSSLDLNSLTVETLKFLESEARKRNIAINLKLGENLPCTRSDPAQLQQVLVNLVGNALAAICKDGLLTISTACHPDPASAPGPKRGELSVAVTDSGPGIPPDKLGKIFDPFYSTKRSGEGTGLGLAIARSIMDKLGGRITVASEVGRGSTFTLFVPIT